MTNWLRNFSFHRRLLSLAVFNLAVVLLCGMRPVKGKRPTEAQLARALAVG